MTRSPKFPTISAGFDEAIQRFLRVYSSAFDSPGYQNKNRRSKVHASGLLQARLPLAEALASTGCGAAVVPIVTSSGLLERAEAVRLETLLCGQDGDRFIRAAARFTADCRRVDLKEMRIVLADSAITTWRAATILPFLWRPFAQMFLDPSSTGRFARLVGHPFAEAYRTDLDIEVFASLADLTAATAHHLQALHPRDHIDLQSFMWVAAGCRIGGPPTPLPPSRPEHVQYEPA